MKKFISFSAVCAAVMIFFGAYFFALQNRPKNISSGSEYIVALNEIEHLCSLGDTEKASEKTAELTALVRENSNKDEKDLSVLYMTGISLAFLLFISCYCGKYIIRPFEKLTGLADKLALGNFDEPLRYERTNYFGKFTWAFDNMRREIVKARSCEKEAIENNKTVIASLSHDIKTPVASIRAYAEGLEAGMDTSAEIRARYLEVIMRKCDDITRLTNDMLLHSLADMEKLKITPEKFELGEFAQNVINDISADKNDIHFSKPAFFTDVFADRNRTAQMIENLINNARKYAKTDIYISLEKEGENAVMRFRDGGKGIPDEDIPFIFDKFYRGHNCGNEHGSGLGLYIVRYIVDVSGGDVSAKNLPDGFEVTVSLPLESNVLRIS